MCVRPCLPASCDDVDAAWVPTPPERCRPSPRGAEGFDLCVARAEPAPHTSQKPTAADRLHVKSCCAEAYRETETQREAHAIRGAQGQSRAVG